MAKKAVPAAKSEVSATKEKVKVSGDAIAAVRSLENFIKDRGGLEAALGTVARVGDLVALMGSFDELKTALEMVGQEPTPAAG
jgi:hypothetical protein